MMRSRRIGPRSGLLVFCVGLAVLCAGCSAAPAQGEQGPGAQNESLTVFAAASLTAPFTAIGQLFETQHPGSRVVFNFAGSADLVSQLDQGAAADAFAAADTSTMNDAVAANLVAGPPVTFATNSMTIAVPPTNPASIGSFADLARPGVRLVVCLPTVPCGAASAQVARNTGTLLQPVSEESSVTDVLNKVTAGDADAGVVYLSDIHRAGGQLANVGIPSSVNVVNRNQLATLTGGPSPGLAEEFRQLVLSRRGQQILLDAGFGAP
ncbi:MAG: molybdate transport system substrate-binding protein [Actinomycetota bacterium]|nr:molybdate transport system substrate-binding protein [Actinomycetota bacterium]